jgi:hypothetical protein
MVIMDDTTTGKARGSTARGKARDMVRDRLMATSMDISKVVSSYSNRENQRPHL